VKAPRRPASRTKETMAVILRGVSTHKRSVYWLRVWVQLRRLPKARIHGALDEVLSFRSPVFGKGKSNGLDNQSLYDALRIEAVIVEL
jgi:hypothetical protein